MSSTQKNTHGYLVPTSSQGNAHREAIAGVKLDRPTKTLKTGAVEAAKPTVNEQRHAEVVNKFNAAMAKNPTASSEQAKNRTSELAAQVNGTGKTNGFVPSSAASKMSGALQQKRNQQTKLADSLRKAATAKQTSDYDASYGEALKRVYQARNTAKVPRDADVLKSYKQTSDSDVSYGEALNHAYQARNTAKVSRDADVLKSYKQSRSKTVDDDITAALQRALRKRRPQQ